MIKNDKVKSTDLKWIDNVPADWEIKRLKDFGTFQNGVSKGKEYFGFGYPFVSYGNIYNNTISIENIDKLANSTSEEQKLYSVKEGDVFFTRTSETIDEIGISSTCLETIEKATFSGFVIRFRQNGRVISKEFSNYYFKAYVNRLFLSNEISIVTRASLNQGVLGSLPVLIPSKKEQTQIANYLDTKTQALDKKTNLLSQKANYYKEYRKSLINEAVCKGLEKKVKLKDSELGFKVNNNFTTYRLKDIGYLYSGLTGKSGDDFNQDENVNNKGFIPFTNIANNMYLKKDHLGVVVVENNENQNSVKKEDLFFLMSSEGYEDIGKSAILDDDLEETYLNSFCKGYRITNKKVNPYFINYLLLSDNYRKQLTVEGKGFTRINLKMEKVNNFIIYIPKSYQEQTEIANYLDLKTQTIDKIVGNINTQINTLKELRKTLINDVVTGKIKVTSN